MPDETPITDTWSFALLWETILENRSADAVILCQQAQDSEKPVPPALVKLINGFAEPKSLAQLVPALSSEEGKPGGWLALFLGLGHLSLGQGNPAQTLIERASEHEACRAPALVHLAAMYLMQKNPEMARECIREGMSLAKQLGEFNVLKARLLVQEGDLEGASAELIVAREKGKTSPHNLVRFELELLLAQGQEEAAIEAAKALLVEGVNGVTDDDVTNIGLQTLTNCGALDAANDYLDQALEEDGDNLLLLTHRAEIANLMGRFRVAGAAVSRALKQDEDSVGLLIQKAHLAGKAFSHDDGMEAIDKVLELLAEAPAPRGCDGHSR